jgi:hypothetical protein
MRSLFPAVALLLILWSIAGTRALSTVQSDEAPASTPAEPAKPAAPATTPPSSADNDAAAKHAKRTACLKQARAKKLVGAQKTAFIKDCAAAP